MSNVRISPEDQAQYTELLRRASTDAEFRELCLTDPRQAIESFGIKAPKEGNVLFHQHDDTVVQLPPFQAEAEISDEDLENVAGGCGGSSCKNNTTEIGCTPGESVLPF